MPPSGGGNFATLSPNSVVTTVATQTLENATQGNAAEEYITELPGQLLYLMAKNHDLIPLWSPLFRSGNFF